MPDLKMMQEIIDVLLAILSWWMEFILIILIITFVSLLKKESAKTKVASTSAKRSVKRNISREEELLRLGLILVVIVFISKLLFRIGSAIVNWFRSIGDWSSNTWWTLAIVVVTLSLAIFIFQSKWKRKDMLKLIGRIAIAGLIVAIIAVRPWKYLGKTKKSFDSSIEQNLTPATVSKNPAITTVSLQQADPGPDIDWGINHLEAGKRYYYDRKIVSYIYAGSPDDTGILNNFKEGFEQSVYWHTIIESTYSHTDKSDYHNDGSDGVFYFIPDRSFTVNIQPK